jgi:hypothetical protein
MTSFRVWGFDMDLFIAIAGSSAGPLPPLNFLLADLTISDQRIDARLRQSLTCAVDAES